MLIFTECPPCPSHGARLVFADCVSGYATSGCELKALTLSFDRLWGLKTRVGMTQESGPGLFKYRHWGAGQWVWGIKFGVRVCVYVFF